MPKRDITPHKGGRTERLYLRTTPEVKRKAQQIAAQTGRSVADIFEEYVNEQEIGMFKMEQSKLQEVIDKFNDEVDPRATNEVIEAQLFADWDEGNEHQEWLDTADVDEIVEWLASFYETEGSQ